jgi:hypothetical protein
MWSVLESFSWICILFVFGEINDLKRGLNALGLWTAYYCFENMLEVMEITYYY